jgi:dephospho-CoA kinase
MKIIGVTGISGSGTSTVAGILEELGGYVISADKLAHEAILKGKIAFFIIIKTFGTKILDTNGEINRGKLGALVFGEAEKLALLESIIHPQVWTDTQELLDKARASGKYPFAVIDAPLLIESGMRTLCDTVILVTASDTTRAERIMRRDGIAPEAAARRLASRVGDEELKPFAQVIIDNDGDLEGLRKKIKNAVTP